MGIDTSETLAQRAAQSLVDLNEAILEGAGDLAVECVAVITALAAANAQLERERDALLDEWREIAATITVDWPEVGALWPMVSDVVGTLSAVRLHFKNEVAAHNAAKAERDAATAALAKAEGERDRLREALRNVLPHAWAAEYHDDWIGNGVRREACVAAEAALTPAPEAPNAAVREAGSALWTEDHRQKMAQEASAILDEMRQGAPKDGE